MSDWKSRLKRLFWISAGWVTAVLFVAAALSLLFEAPLASLVLIGMAALVLPPVRTRYPILALSGTQLSFALFVSLLLVGFAVGWHEERAQARQKREAEEAREARRDSLREVLAGSRDSILNEIRTALDREDAEAALKTVRVFVSTGDSTILTLRDAAQGIQRQREAAAREEELRELVATIPANDVVRNRDIYSELTELDPDNPTYQQRLERYTQLAEAEAERRQEERRRAQAERERRRSTTEEGGVRMLKVSARYSGTQIHVTNQSGENWTDCTLEINSGIIRGGWSTGPVRIPAGETVTGGILTFTKSDGERFNPSRYEVQTLDVRCDTPEGRHFWSGTFR